jgi:hypothetical protein
MHGLEDTAVSTFLEERKKDRKTERQKDRKTKIKERQEDRKKERKTKKFQVGHIMVWVRIADNGSQKNSRRQKKPLIG